MLKVLNTEVTGWRAALRGMRNAHESWAKSDTGYGLGVWFGDDWDDVAVDSVSEIKKLIDSGVVQNGVQIGENDLTLAKKLVKAGSSHSKYLRMITVQCDIDYPLYVMKELDTYKVATVQNSTSTMHRVTVKPFTREMFSCNDMCEASVQMFDRMIVHLNDLRDCYNNFEQRKEQGTLLPGVYTKADAWRSLIQLLPENFMYRITWQANYAVLAKIYHDRKGHKLSEWKTFLQWIEKLPYSELITGDFSLEE